MANLKVNNYHRLRLRINKDEYWDFFVNKDSYGHYGNNADNCLISYMDLTHADCDDSGWIKSESEYGWADALSVGYTLYNITYTGVDNGLFTFRKDRILNKDFLANIKALVDKLDHELAAQSQQDAGVVDGQNRKDHLILFHCDVFLMLAILLQMVF